jgi:hypothetical protein
MVQVKSDLFNHINNAQMIFYPSFLKVLAH